jgi:hypothetical protein
MTAATTPMLRAYPGDLPLEAAPLASAVDALVTAAEACTACADACLDEATVAELTGCIRACLDCADVAGTAARVLSRCTAYDPEISSSLLAAAVLTARACALECSRHAGMHDHCRICAEACRIAETACRDLLVTVR